LLETTISGSFFYGGSGVFILVGDSAGEGACLLGLKDSFWIESILSFIYASILIISRTAA